MGLLLVEDADARAAAPAHPATDPSYGGLRSPAAGAQRGLPKR